MSRIYDALKKLEAERADKAGGKSDGGNGNGGSGRGNGNGNGNGNGQRGRWRWLFPSNGHTNGHARVGLSFDLGPEVEEAYQRLGTNLLVVPASEAGSPPRLFGITASRHGEG